MRFGKFARCTQSMFCSAFFVTAVFATAVVSCEALANPQPDNAVAVASDVIQLAQTGQDTECSSVDVETCQRNENQAVAKITLQNIHSVTSRNIYGSELMTKSEIAKFRQDLKQCETTDQLESFLANHRVLMDARAVKRGVFLN